VVSERVEKVRIVVASLRLAGITFKKLLPRVYESRAIDIRRSYVRNSIKEEKGKGSR
jgi:hypothetical protein